MSCLCIFIYTFFVQSFISKINRKKLHGRKDEIGEMYRNISLMSSLYNIIFNKAWATSRYFNTSSSCLTQADQFRSTSPARGYRSKKLFKSVILWPFHNHLQRYRGDKSDIVRVWRIKVKGLELRPIKTGSQNIKVLSRLMKLKQSWDTHKLAWIIGQTRSYTCDETHALTHRCYPRGACSCLSTEDTYTLTLRSLIRTAASSRFCPF